MSHETHPAEVAALESALAALTPLPARIERDQLMFRAGQAAVPRHRWFWPSATGVMALLAVTLGFMLGLRPTPAPIVQIVHVPVEVQPTPQLVAKSSFPAPSATGPMEPAKAEDPYWPGPTAYVRIREQVFRCGLDALPNPSPRAAPLQTTEQPVTVESLLGLPPRSPAIPNLFKLATFFNAGAPL